MSLCDFSPPKKRLKNERLAGLLSPCQTLVFCHLRPPFPVQLTRAKTKGRSPLFRFTFKLLCQTFFPSAVSPERILFILRIYFQKTPELHNLWNFSKSDLSSGTHMGNQMLPCIRGALVWEMRAGASQPFEMTPLVGPRKRHPGREHHLQHRAGPPERNGLSKWNSLTWGADGVLVAMLRETSSLQDSFSCTGPLIPPFH